MSFDEQGLTDDAPPAAGRGVVRTLVSGAAAMVFVTIAVGMAGLTVATFQSRPGRAGVAERSPSVPAKAEEVEDLGGGWVAFRLDVGGKPRRFLSGRDALVELRDDEPAVRPAR